MSTGIRRLIIILLGALAGLAAWPLLELLLSFQELFGSYFLFSLAQGALFGLILGLFFGSGEGLTGKEGGKIISGALTGAITGLAGGTLGFLSGQGILLSILAKSGEEGTLLLARLIGWIILGGAVGLSEGIRAKSGRKSLIGLAGGVLGGLIGGGSIELFQNLFPGLLYARLLAFVLFGSLISLFYALLERRISPGVLRILNGSKRGKEYSLVQRKIRVGASAKQDIALTDYKDVQDEHALFRLKGDDLYLEPRQLKDDRGKKPLILINDTPLEGTELLKYEDVIQIGSAKLFFRTE
jgi:hypothetical protein